MNKNEVIRASAKTLSLCIDNDNIKLSSLLKEHFPEAFEDEKPLDRWYVEEGEDKLFVFEGKKERYGINRIGEWFKSERAFKGISETLKLATDEEILERLSAYATKMGYVDGVKVKTLVNGFSDVDMMLRDDFFINRNNLWRICGDDFNALLMEGGKWAEIVEEELTFEERLKRLEESVFK